MSFETLPKDDHRVGNALTGVEFARDLSGTMPRMLGVNHHPEIMDSGAAKGHHREASWDHGEVTRAWYEERMERCSPWVNRDVEIAQQLAMTTGFTFVWPLAVPAGQGTSAATPSACNRVFEMHENQIRRDPLRRPA